MDGKALSDSPEDKHYDLYFGGKRADITMHILKRKIEYSITQAEDMFNLAQKLNNAKGMSSAKTMSDDCLYDDRTL